MADIAFVFHWHPERMDEMRVGELMRWRQLAVHRHNDANKAT